MGSRARQTAFSVAGLAAVGGATLALTAPAFAAVDAGDDENATGAYEQAYDSDHRTAVAIAGSYSKIEKTEVTWAIADTKRESVHTAVKAEPSSEKCDQSCEPGHGKDLKSGYGLDDEKWQKDRVGGLYRSYKACKNAGLRGVHKGWWDSYDCDFKKRGYQGLHQSWNKYGSNDWRNRGRWALSTQHR